MIRRPPRYTRTDTLFPLHAARPICPARAKLRHAMAVPITDCILLVASALMGEIPANSIAGTVRSPPPPAMASMNPEHTQRSEEHTSELQSLMRISYAVFCLKKKKQNTIINQANNRTHNKHIE